MLAAPAYSYPCAVPGSLSTVSQALWDQGSGKRGTMGGKGSSRYEFRRHSSNEFCQTFERDEVL